MEISDNQLVQRILDGDGNSFAILVERYNKQVYNLMYRYSGSAEDAADMTQEVFLRTFSKLKSYREQKRFFSWLYTLALNYAKDWSRKQRTYGTHLDRWAAEEKISETIPTENLESKQEVEGLVEALDSLPEDRREMVILRYRYDRSIRELSEIFQISESAIKMRLHRSLNDLGQKLEGRHHG